MERHLIEEPRGRARSTANETGTAAPLIPPRPTISKLQEVARGCRACPLWKTGTQTVFGEGSRRAKVVFVGEQPGNDEDLAGKPFVGPAGKLLDKALVEAGINRDEVYVTNTVKHFKWEPSGKRRIHKKPNAREIAACRPWLDAELGVLRPEVIVCLGATAAQALISKDFRVSQRRGEFVDSKLAGLVMATVHPSSILRAPDDETRHREMKKLISDLGNVAKAMRSLEVAEWEKHTSEAIARTRYHAEFKLLDVYFTTGKTYRYGHVTAAEVRALMNASSLGTYFNQVFKPQHEHVWPTRS
jgi:uracil-DNA glycosylase family protein